MSAPFPSTWTVGVVRHGVADPSPYVEVMTIAERDVKCAGLGHPGVTYNPNPGTDKTWCICGGKTYPGNARQWGFAEEGGPLCRWVRRE